MPRHALLNNVDHRDLRVRSGHDAALGDALMFAPVVPAEFRQAQAHYPIVFQATASGSFQPMALFGFREGENLFLGPEGWDAWYIPLAVERQPFLIGKSGEELMVHVDLDSPRLAGDGEPVFLPHGGSSDYLQRVSAVLRSLHDGLEATPAFVAALRQLDLLESFVLDVQQADGSQHRLAGFFTINEERLAALDGAALGALHAAGYLEPIYMALASLANLRDLIERQRRRACADA
jgi:hypothetical protein